MNSVYSRTILYYLLALIVGFSFLGLCITKAFKNYVFTEKTKFMLNQAKEISEIYKYSYDTKQKNTSYFFQQLKILDEYSSYDFFIVDKNDAVIAKSNNAAVIQLGEILDYDDNAEYENGGYFVGTDSFNDIYDGNVYFLGYPIELGENSALVYVTTSLKALNSSVKKTYVFTGLFIFIASIIGYGIVTVAMAKTMKRMSILNDAAKRIAVGRFDQRIEIKGNDELSQLASSFNEMAESLQNQNESKNKFLSNIAHDIRSPITSITGFLDAILDGTIPPEKTTKYIRIIKSEADRLNKLVNALLEFNRDVAMSDRLVLKDFDINKLIKDTVDSLYSRILDKNINLISSDEGEVFVNADYDKIQRVIYNLLDNAIKFVNENGTITIDVEKQKSTALISISNTGVGLTEQECKRVFDRLYKTDSSRGMDKIGMGLGLSIVKEFLLMHDQIITVKSEIGEYTTFSFSLNLSENN